METAVVTGAAAGTGRMIAQRLEDAGFAVAASDIDRADMSVMDDVRTLIEETRPDVLVNCAGGGGHVPPHFPEASLEQWSMWLDLNLRGPMLATQLALQAGARAVVNIASTAGLERGRHVSPEYAAAKAGLIRFTTALADSRVSCVIPDWIDTERVTPEDRAADPRPPIPMNAVADAVLELVASPSARVIVLDR
jgi:NAD(P)-dependent dehydrogenase (short-subunit alcohol dehydrogenase family)